MVIAAWGTSRETVHRWQFIGAHTRSNRIKWNQQQQQQQQYQPDYGQQSQALVPVQSPPGYPYGAPPGGWPGQQQSPYGQQPYQQPGF